MNLNSPDGSPPCRYFERDDASPTGQIMHEGQVERPPRDVWAMIEPWETVVDSETAAFQERLTKVRRHLHMHPEPSGEEVETSRYLCERLQEQGIAAHLLRDGLGVVADVDIGQPTADNRRIAIRADIDALRLHDEKVCNYRSQNDGICHACGHDVHATIGLGAALLAQELSNAVGGSGVGAKLRFLFQPAEETCQGAQWLLEQNVLDGVDGILALHVDPERPAGTVGIRYGTLTANCDEVVIRVSGSGGHAARPHHTVDPIAIAGHLVTSLYGFLPRTVDAREPSVFSIGMINGGYASNVIPETVELHGTLRTTEVAARDHLKARIRHICEGAAEASDATIDVEFINPLRAIENADEFAAALAGASRRVLGKENVQRIELPSMGGEDFAFYLDHVPGALLRLGCGIRGIEQPFLHSPLFDVDERILNEGSRILLRAALVLSAGQPVED